MLIRKWLYLSLACTLITLTAVSASAIAGVKINTASKRGLMRFKRTGPNVASNIIEHRDRYGPFWSLEAVQGIKGIGALWVEDNKKKIRITPELRCWNCGRIIKLEQGQKSGVCPFCKRKWPKSTE